MIRVGFSGYLWWGKRFISDGMTTPDLALKELEKLTLNSMVLTPKIDAESPSLSIFCCGVKLKTGKITIRWVWYSFVLMSRLHNRQPVWFVFWILEGFMLQNLNNLNFVRSNTVFFYSFFRDKVSVNCIKGRQLHLQGLPG